MALSVEPVLFVVGRPLFLVPAIFPVYYISQRTLSSHDVLEQDSFSFVIFAASNVSGLICSRNLAGSPGCLYGCPPTPHFRRIHLFFFPSCQTSSLSNFYISEKNLTYKIQNK